MARETILAAFMLALALAHGTTALYSADGKVKMLTAKNFKSAVLESDVPAVVEFYAPWCGHCRQLSPIYTKVAENLHGIVTIGAVDCDQEANKPLCSQYGVQGFPTLKVFPADKPKSGTKKPIDYNGPRAAKAIAEAGTAGLTDKLIQHPASEAAFEKFRAGSALPKVVLVTDKRTTTALFKSLSMRFRGRLDFAEVRDPSGPVATGLGVSVAPTLVLLPAAGEPTIYDGKLKAKDLVDFLKPFAGPKGGASSAGKTEKPFADKPSGAEAGKSDATGKTEKPFAEKKAGREEAQPKKDNTLDPVTQVVELNLADVDSILEEDDVWLLGAYEGVAGSECTQQAAALVKLANELGGITKIGELNATGIEASELEERGIDGPLPGGCARALLLKPFGEQSEPEDPFPTFSGNMTAKEVQGFVMEAFPAGAVVRLTAASIDTFMGADPERPKVLLFTNKEQTPALFAAVAANVQDTGAAFAAVHERETEVLKNFKVSKVPKVVVAWSQESEEKDEAGRPLMGARLQPYQGPFKYTKMAEFVRLMASIIAAQNRGLSPESGPAALAPPPPQANHTADLRQLCTTRVGICVIGVLDPVLPDHQEKLEAVSVIRLKRVGQALQFLWLDARRQRAFLQAFGLQPGDAPTAIVLAPRKKRFAVLQGELKPERLDSFLEDVMSGRQRTTPIQEVPGLDEADAAAGAAASKPAGDQPEISEPEEVIEEEFDLADIMSEEIADSSLGGTKAERLAQIDAQLKARAEE